MPDRFDATVRRDAASAVVDLAGDIDGDAARGLHTAYDEAAAHGVDRIVLNFEATGYINSTGIAVIVELLARARAEHREIHAYGLSDHYRQIFLITPPCRLRDTAPRPEQRRRLIGRAQTGETDARARLIDQLRGSQAVPDRGGDRGQR